MSHTGKYLPYAGLVAGLIFRNMVTILMQASKKSLQKKVSEVFFNQNGFLSHRKPPDSFATIPQDLKNVLRSVLGEDLQVISPFFV